MKCEVILYLLFQFFTSIYCAELLKDVIYLPTTKEVITEESSIKKSASAPNTKVPRAWITGDINKSGLRAITVCAWVKSLDQDGTGTVFAYVNQKERVEFGLIGLKTKVTSKQGSGSPGDVYVVVKGKQSAPISLGLDDVRWHHVCATWSSRYGLWKVFKDGVQIDRGQQMKKRHVLARGGRYYIGGGEFNLIDEDQAINASSISEHTIRVSTGFRSKRKRRNVFSTETKRMVGKFTDFYVWSKVLSKAQVQSMSNCTLKIRNLFNEEVKLQTSASRIFNAGRKNRRSGFLWAGRNVVYGWSIDTISLQRPATLEVSGDLCGHTISIECETDRMLLSMDTKVADWYNVQQYGIHLADHRCAAQRKGNYLVFHIPAMEACGTTREVVGKEVLYTNYITNSPKVGDIFVGQPFRAKVVCKFPLDTSTTVTSVVPGNPPEVAGKTPVKNPVTGRQDLEGVFVLSMDDKFTDPVREGNAIDTGKSFWGGIVVQGVYFNSPDEDVNVVVDECWVENQQERSPLVSQQGCNGTARIIDNGRRPDVRMEFSSRDIRENTPTFIGCSFHPCVGENCAPNCGLDTPNRIGNDSPRRRQRDITEQEMYEIRIGPVTTREEIITDEKDDNDLPSETFLLAVILPAAIIFIILLLTAIGLVFCCTKRSQNVHQVSKRRWSDRKSSSKKSRPAVRTQSFTFCRPSYSSYNVYPPSFHAIVRAKLKSVGMNSVEEESDQNTNTMVSTVY